MQHTHTHKAVTRRIEAKKVTLSLKAIKLYQHVRTYNTLETRLGKKYTSGPRYWNIPVLVNTGTFLVYQYCLKMWYLCSLECAGAIQKLTILERKNDLVLANTRIPVSGTWSILFPRLVMIKHTSNWLKTEKWKKVTFCTCLGYSSPNLNSSIPCLKYRATCSTSGHGPITFAIQDTLQHRSALHMWLKTGISNSMRSCQHLRIQTFLKIKLDVSNNLGKLINKRWK